MSALVLAGVGALGGLGAVARLMLDGAVSARAGRGFPWGTLAVNLTGSFALGVLAGATVSGTVCVWPARASSARSRRSAPGRWRAIAPPRTAAPAWASRTSA